MKGCAGYVGTAKTLQSLKAVRKYSCRAKTEYPFPTCNGICTTLTSNASDQQLNAIRHTDGPLHIVAGPGSGKSYTVVERVAHLLQTGKATTSSLLVISFTDKAASELRSRITQRLMTLGLTASLSGQQVCTFHALCHRLLSEHRMQTRLGSGFRLMDDFEQRYLVYRCLFRFLEIPNVDSLFHGRRQDRWNKAGQLCRWINKVSEEALDTADLLNSPMAELVTLGEVFQHYQLTLHEENVLDLPGLQTALLKLLDENPDIATALQERFSHVMVDEYQDTNTIQEKILLRLINPQHNLCVVGDDDQSLYRFRGASVRNLLEFPQLFPSTPSTRIDLSINYRSHPRIIHFCRWWMGDEEWEFEDRAFRFEKSIEPRSASFDDTPTVIKLVGHEPASSGPAWSDSVTKLLEVLRVEGALSDWNQVAFLFHSVRSKEATELATALEAHGIPVHSPRSKKFFDRDEVRLVIGAFAHVFPCIHSIRIKGIQFYSETWRYYTECYCTLQDHLNSPENAACKDWLDGYKGDLLREQLDFAGGFCGLLYQLFQFPLFGESLQNEIADDSVVRERRTRNLALLSQMLSRFDEIHKLTTFNGRTVNAPLEQFLNHYLRCLIDDGINEFESAAVVAPSGCVSFLTIHQAKGLEFPVVICGSMDASPWAQEHGTDKALVESGLLHKPVFEPANKIADYDFKRLFYTAFSRAQNLLVLSVRNTLRHQPTAVGPFKKFLSELPDWDSDQFEPEQLNLGSIKPVKTYPELSLVEDIHLYENCPRKYRFFRVLGFANIFDKPDALGRLVRDTLDDVHRHRMMEAKDSIDEHTVLEWLEENRSKMSRLDQLALDPKTMSNAQDLVQAYADNLHQEQIAVTAADIELKFITQSYSIKTKTDVTTNKDGELSMRVFRSLGLPTELENLGQYQSQRQINMFSEEITQLLRQPVRSLQAINAMQGTYEVASSTYAITTSPEVAQQAVDMTVRKMLREDFHLDRRPVKLCSRCEMQPCCDGKDCGSKRHV